jgi:hypothetical protein
VYQAVPHTCVFFGVVAEMLLHVEPSRIPNKYRKEYMFGYLVLNLMVEIFEDFRSSGDPQSFRRFNLYQLPKVPSARQWNGMCHEITLYCMHVFAAFGDLKTKMKQTAEYKNISKIYPPCRRAVEYYVHPIPLTVSQGMTTNDYICGYAKFCYRESRIRVRT